MKKIILSLSVGALILGMSGCGSSGDSKPDANSINIEFKTSGTFDLAQYITADKDQSNNYVKKVYTNNKGKKDYKDTADKTTYPVKTITHTSDISVEEFIDGKLDSTYSFLADRIKTTDDVNNTDIIARFANKGDYISKSVKTITSDGLPIHYEMVCKLSKKLDSKTVLAKDYQDVIQVVCTYNSSANSSINNSAITYTSNGVNTIYAAKGIGTILDINEDCSETKVGDATPVKECQKEVEEITSVIK